MQIHRNEIATGILVLGTFIGVIAILIVVGMPGLIRPQNTYRIYFDNAEGIRPGASVLLAGRQIGKVKSLESPVPYAKRPRGHPEDEVSIDVEVDRSAAIYNNVTANLAEQGLMGLMEIDFVRGDASTGLAENHTHFIGTRVPGMGEAMATMADDVKRLTGPDSDLGHTLANVRQLTAPDSSLALTLDHVKQLTAPDADLALTLKNVKNLTGPDSNLALTLHNAKTLTQSLNNSQLPQIITNAEQFTDTIKHQPWRLIWPTTKTYPDDKKVAEDKDK